MQSLFRLENDLVAGSYHLRQWPYAQQGVLQNIKKIEDFYHTYSQAAPSSHVLIKIINAVNVSRNLEFDRYMVNCFACSINVAQALKLTTSTSYGQVWDGEFYGQGSNEIIIGYADYFPIADIASRWKTLSPVTVLSHNQTNSQYLIPDGKTNSKEKGVSVIAINIPMLMAMYYHFNLEQDRVASVGEARETPTQFVFSYPMTNMVRSHADIAYLNRMYNYTIGVPSMPALRTHSFYTINYDDALDNVIGQQVEYTKYMTSKLVATMRSIHMPVAGNMLELSKLPRVTPTLQCFWALVASRLKFLALICAGQKDAKQASGSELKNIARQLQIQQTKKVMKNTLGLEGYYQLAPLMDKAEI